MPLYDAIEIAAAAATAHFSTQLAAIVTARGLSGIDTTATIHKRRPAEHFAGLNPDVNLPGIGVYPTPDAASRTSAKWQGKRDWRNVLNYDYFAMGPDPAKLEEQVELSLEALMRVIDRMSGSGLLGMGEEPGSVAISVSELAESQDYYQHRGVVTFSVITQETGL